MRNVFLIFIFLISSGSISAQNYIGTDFRFSFLANIDPAFNGLPNFDIPIEAFEDATVTVEFGTPADAYYLSETITLLAGESGVVSFNQIFLNQNTTGVIDNRSFHVTSTGDIRIYAFHNRAFFSDSTPVLPTSALTSSYMVLTRIDPDFVAPALYSVIATEDNTTVNFLNTGASVNGPAGIPFSLTLNAGEVITIASVDGLTGSTVTSDSDKPIAVFAGNRQAEINTACGADNHLYEQLHPTEYWGTIHPIIQVPSIPTIVTKFLALEDNTELYAGCNLIATLNSGETFEAITGFNVIVRSSGPVLVALFTQGFECSLSGDPNMRFLQPLDKANDGFLLETNSGFQQGLPDFSDYYFLNLAMPTDETDQILINGAPVGGWTPFTTLPDISYVNIAVDDISSQTLNVQSTAPFWSEYVSYSGADAMTMSMGTTTTMQVPDEDLLIVSLGPDQTICEGQTIILDPGLNLTGTWQDGSEQETYTVTEPGTYSVQIDGGCNGGTDEITIEPGESVNLGLPESYILCQGGDVEIGVTDDPDINYEWNSGAQTSEITVSNPGDYFLTASFNGFCATTETTTVLLQESPELIIDGPTAICNGNEGILVASGDEGDFEWSDGTVGNTLEISAPGNFSVSLTTDLGCVSIESSTVTAAAGPKIEIEGPESICQNQSLPLLAVGDEGDLMWDDGSTDISRTINSPGTYNVILTAADGCSETASIIISLLDSPIIIAADVEFCASQSVTVTATSTNSNLEWPGFSENSTIQVFEGGTYKVTGENNCGTTSKNVVFTELDCSCEAYVPNAFTPNGDGLNDLFYPQILCEPDSYSISIFNRWGILVFESINFDEKWNGNSNNSEDYYASDGVYFYFIEYINPLLPIKETIQIRGTVTLLR